MRSRTIQETKSAMVAEGENWRMPLMEFVDDLRRTRDRHLLQKSFSCSDEQIDALLASTVEYLCDELKLETPEWVWEIPSCSAPWFVSGYENLKAISIVESPVFFRRRKIFVLQNFLVRV